MSIDWNRECEIVKRLGDGSFAVVFLCTRRDGRPIVMKCIPLTECAFTLSTVQREYQIFSQIRHPRLIECFGFFQCQRSWNFLLEYAPLGSLCDRIDTLNDQHRYFNQNELLDIYTDVLVGVKYLHYRSIIHRDLKPDNILFDAYGRAKITDFGISKIYDQINHSSSSNNSNSNNDTHNNSINVHEMSKIGTPFYMAPEVLNHSTYGFKCDIWSLGIVFYEMCELRHPFGENGTIECFDLSLPFKCPVIDTKAKRYHPSMKKFCEMMIVREPEKRADLNQIVNHHLIRNKFCTVFFEK